MRITTFAMILAAVATAVPAAAQQRDVKVPTGGYSDGVNLSKDSNWRYGNYSMQGVANSGIRPTGAGPAQQACQPTWVVASTDACQPDGTQVAHMTDGCGNTQNTTQQCQAPKTGKWTYHGSGGGGCQTFNTNGYAVCYLVLQCQDPSNNQQLAESSCDASQKPRWYQCAVNGYGQGTCDTFGAPRYDMWGQQVAAPANCNYNGFNVWAGWYTRIGGVCNSAVTAVW